MCESAQRIKVKPEDYDKTLKWVIRKYDLTKEELVAKFKDMDMDILAEIGQQRLDALYA